MRRHYATLASSPANTLPARTKGGRYAFSTHPSITQRMSVRRLMFLFVLECHGTWGLRQRLPCRNSSIFIFGDLIESPLTAGSIVEREEMPCHQPKFSSGLAGEYL